ncbi:hypothetical protein PVAG01_11161 [Phlyctema vagabunda]|uniref:Uncharacterized protein n=1 Tax=Phlyctema vagabunda TaxID=108571 RepID=A0ABR4P1I5_9HELO
MLYPRFSAFTLNRNSKRLKLHARSDLVKRNFLTKGSSWSWISRVSISRTIYSFTNTAKFGDLRWSAC